MQNVGYELGLEEEVQDTLGMEEEIVPERGRLVEFHLPPSLSIKN